MADRDSDEDDTDSETKPFIRTGRTDNDSLDEAEFIELQKVHASKDDQEEKDSTSSQSDDVISQLGGCGAFQIVLAITVQSMKLVTCWGMGANAFFAFVPRWRCVEFSSQVVGNNSSEGAHIANETIGLSTPHTYVNGVRGYSNWSTKRSVHLESTTASVHSGDEYWTQQCEIPGIGSCVKFEYKPGIYSWVNEFDLVCDKSWVTASMISVQMTGTMLGSVIVGPLGDLYGRKKPFMSSMLILGISNILCFFAGDWKMLAAARFFIGMGSAFFLCTCCIVQGEFMLSKWRSTAIGFPSWALELSLFVLVAHWLPNWKHMTLLTSLIAIAFLSTWFVIPESLRWQIVKGRLREARGTINKVGAYNRKRISDESFRQLCQSIQDKSSTHSTSYSVAALLRNRDLLKLTVPLTVCWLALGFVSYGISFGIKKLSGDFFLNLSLFAIASIPAKLIAIWLQNRIGRRSTAILSYVICVIGGLVAGIVQHINLGFVSTTNVTTYFALAASLGADSSWGPIQTLTVELYPTVARNTGFGVLSTVARLGAVIGPQFVFLEDYLAGLLYFMVAILSAISIIALCTLPETNNRTLPDTISENT